MPAQRDPRGDAPRAGLDAAMAFLGEAFRKVDPVPDDENAVAGARRFVTGNERLTPEEQVDIYRRQYWLRHVDSLVEDYPGLVHVLGDDAFEAFARAYLLAHPPQHPSLRDLGHAIVAFGAGFDFPENVRGACRDMLRYEHAYVDLFDGAEPPPLAQGKLETVPEDAWDTARIVLHPLLVTMRVGYPVHRVRSAVKRGETAPALDAVDLRLVLSRQDNRIHVDELDEEPFALLEHLGRGLSLVAACEAVAKPLDEAAQKAFEANVGAWFASWTARRFIVDVEVV